jgi:hypothetical protein
MTQESQVDPEYERITLIASSCIAFADFGTIQNIMLQRKHVAVMILEDWKNKELWRHFNFLEKNIKNYLLLK